MSFSSYVPQVPVSLITVKYTGHNHTCKNLLGAEMYQCTCAAGHYLSVWNESNPYLNGDIAIYIYPNEMIRFGDLSKKAIFDGGVPPTQVERAINAIYRRRNEIISFRQQGRKQSAIIE